MKHRTVLPIAAILFLSCAGKSPIQPPEAHIKQDPTINIMCLLGTIGIGHACPCDGKIFTAFHLANPLFKLGFTDYKASYRWSTPLGDHGVVIGDSVILGADLATMKLVDGKISVYYNHATESPESGDSVFWVEYSMSNPLEAHKRKAGIVRSVSGHIVFDPAPTPGASGGCLLNDKNEVVGIVTWGIRTRAGVSGIAVSLSGPWWPKGN